MNTNKIDKIIINGLKESERRNEIYANQAKPRVWEAIDKPKRSRTVNWWLVSAMAAAISFFLISTILFLKLESQKREILALQSYAGNEISPIESTNEKVSHEVEDVMEKKPTIIQESIPVVNKEITISQVKANSYDREENEGIEVSDPIIPDPNLVLMTIPKPEIDVPEIFHQEINSQVVQLPELIEESEIKSKKQAKLKLKIGNGSNVQAYQKTYALNIKI